MLPDKNCGDSARDIAERQSNYLILSSLEQKLPPELFRQILTEGSMHLPSRLSWAGTKSESTFGDLKMAQGHLNSGFLTSLLHAVGELQKRTGSKESKNTNAANMQTLLKQTSQTQKYLKTSLFAKVRQRPGQLTAAMRREVELSQFMNFRRMKTVFCHADHSTDEVSSIFNVQFDRTGRFIISGADDAILKVWDRDTLTLQASLHGHLDFITDIDVSKCNRFIASAGKDAQVIIWDLKMGRVVKRLTNHQSLINRLLFVAPRVPTTSSAGPEQQQVGSHATVKAFVAASEQQQEQSSESQTGQPIGGPESSFVKDQFLLTCSDDGTVHLYDFSPLSRASDGGQGRQRTSSSSANNRGDFDEMRIRRSGRRSAGVDQQPSRNGAADANDQQDAANEVYIFDVALKPDDYRPGTRNKKLDAVACSSAGIVVAGTSTGEIFAWKLNFTEIARRNTAESYKCLGQFKVCKNAGVQFAEFSPSNDLLMTGSTDGSVKIWRLDIPASKSLQQQALRTFSMADDSRLVVTIDEKNGCIKTNSISFFDEDGAENFEYVPVPQPVSGHLGYGKSFKNSLIKFSKSQCDAIKWSVRGRFAIASITSQVEDPRNNNLEPGVEEFKEEVCRIKIWDTVNETFYDDLARPCGHQLKKNSWVLAPHPILEELLMTGSDGGTLILWNLETKQIIHKYSQYGVYSIDGYVRDNPLDGKFSCDGKAFIVGNQLGTISIFSCEPVEHQYQATRVQQFFMYDRNTRSSNNPFEMIENRPQICGYNMIPHEAQPARPLIGRFPSDAIQQSQQQLALVPIGRREEIAISGDQEEEKLTDLELLEQKKAQSRAFERKLITAKELGHLEEKYYQHQLSNCLQESYQPNVLEQGNQLDAFVESSIEVLGNGERERLESGYEDQSLVNALSPPRRAGASVRNGDFSAPASQNVRSRAQASGQRRAVGAAAGQEAAGPGRRRLVRRSDRTLRDMPEMNGYDSDELLVDGYHQSPQSLYHDGSHSDEDSASDASDLESSPEVVRQRFQVRRANVHEQMRPNQDEVEEEQRNRRAERLARRNETRDPEDDEPLPSRRTAAREARVNSGSVHIDLEDEAPTRRRGRGRPSNAERERMRAQTERRGQDQSDGGIPARRRVIYDEAASQDVTMNDENNSRQTRTRLRQTNARTEVGVTQSSRRGGSGSSPEQQTMNAGSSSRRNARRVIENSSNSRIDDIEERKGSPSKIEKSHNQIIRESGYFLSDREDASAFNFDKMVNHHGKADDSDGRDAKSMAELEPIAATQPDEDYNLIEDHSLIQGTLPAPAAKICSFCQKIDEPLVGPFCKFEDKEQTKMVGQPLYFHQDCIEMNQYSKFCQERKKWVNIGKALQNLVHREQFACFRCQTKGATVQCRDCSKAFHGFKCARMYTLQLGDDENDHAFYQCIFCRNSQNWEDRASELTDKEGERRELEREGLLHEKTYLKELSKIEKGHLLAPQGYAMQQSDQNTLGASYNPQVNDFVFYFFQGHEYFLTQYSCHYFCGQLSSFPRHRFMPWQKHPRIKKREFVRCRVEQVEVLFPSQRSLNLISMYGSSSTQVTQTPQIIQRVTLAVIDSNQPHAAAQQPNQVKFQVDLFPNQLPDFLVPQAVFTEKYERYVKALQTGIADKTFKVFLKDQNTVKTMRIVGGSCPLEPTLYPNSLWQNIKCVEANPGRSGHGRVTEMPQHRSTRSTRPANQQEPSEDECERVSFWDIQFGGAEEVQAIQKSMHVFEKDERAKLVNTLKDFMDKKKEYIECFIERVPIEVAPDYRSIIPAEMYFNLIKDRINNCYYRSQEQLLSDIDLISYNAVIYNGATHDISLNAKELCEIIRVRLKQAMFTKSDTLLQQQMAQAGKLTVPSRMRTALQQKTQLDEMRNSLHDEPARVSDQMMIKLPVMQHHDESNHKEDEVMPAAAPPVPNGGTPDNQQGVVRLRRNNAAAKQQQQNQPQAAQEETKNGDTNIIRINISAQSSAVVAPVAQASNGQANLLVDQEQQIKPPPRKTSGQKLTNDTAEQAAGAGRPSNNTNRRRNRNSANMLAAEELEEKTKQEATNSVQIEASATENEEVSGTKRITRNNLRSKRQRTE